MTETTADSGTDPIPNRATFYYPQIQWGSQFGPELAAPVDYSCFAGAGGFLSTPSDLVRFGMAMKWHAAAARHRHQLQTPQQLASGEETGYGLGWTLETIRSRGTPRLVSHASRTLLGASARS